MHVGVCSNASVTVHNPIVRNAQRIYPSSYKLFSYKEKPLLKRKKTETNPCESSDDEDEDEQSDDTEPPLHKCYHLIPFVDKVS